MASLTRDTSKSHLAPSLSLTNDFKSLKIDKDARKCCFHLGFPGFLTKPQIAICVNMLALMARSCFIVPAKTPPRETTASNSKVVSDHWSPFFSQNKFLQKLLVLDRREEHMTRGKAGRRRNCNGRFVYIFATEDVFIFSPETFLRLC